MGSCTLGAGGGAVGWARSVSGGSATRGGGMGVGIGVAGASTFVGDTTYGGGATLGGGVTLGGSWGDAVGAGVGELVLQLLSRSRSFAMVSRCSWWAVAGASLKAHNRKLRAWTILSSGVTSG